MPPNVSVDTVHYKIFISGKSGVGKTALAARLAGLNIPNMHYETTGRPSAAVNIWHNTWILWVKLTCATARFSSNTTVLVGIETTVVYWPVKLRESGRVLFFRLQLWDCGENALRRFDHMLPVCLKYHKLHLAQKKAY